MVNGTSLHWNKDVDECRGGILENVVSFGNAFQMVDHKKQ